MLSIALLWKLQSIYLKSLICVDNILIIRHEDLCKEPFLVFNNICNNLGVEFTTRMRRRVKQTTECISAEAHDGKQHDFMRNSSSLKNIWRDKLSQSDQERILDVVGEDMKPFYYR